MFVTSYIVLRTFQPFVSYSLFDKFARPVMFKCCRLCKRCSVYSIHDICSRSFRRLQHSVFFFVPYSTGCFFVVRSSRKVGYGGSCGFDSFLTFYNTPSAGVWASRSSSISRPFEVPGFMMLPVWCVAIEQALRADIIRENGDQGSRRVYC